MPVALQVLASEPHTAERLFKRRGDPGDGRGSVRVSLAGAFPRERLGGGPALPSQTRLDAGDLAARLEARSGLCDLQVAGR